MQAVDLEPKEREAIEAALATEFDRTKRVLQTPPMPDFALPETDEE